MNVCKILLVVFLMQGAAGLNAAAQTVIENTQTAIGKTTYLMHPSGIPATVITNARGTVSNIDGRIIRKTKDTAIDAHEKAVKKLRWSGFQLQTDTAGNSAR